MPHPLNQPIPQCWKALIYGAWLIVSDRFAAAMAIREHEGVQVRLTCLDVECETCAELENIWMGRP